MTRPSRRTILALLGVPTVAPLVARLAPAEAAAPNVGKVRREVSDPIGEPHSVHVIATVAGSERVLRPRYEINEEVGAVEVLVGGRGYLRHPVNYIIRATRPGEVSILPTLVQAVVRLRPDQRLDDISVRHTGLLAGVAEPDYTVRLLTR